MSPSEDERARIVTGLVSAVAALQAGEQHAARDMDSLRREIRDSETRVLAEVNKVDQHCDQRFREAATNFNAKFEALKTDLKEDRTGRRGLTVAWIGGGVLLIASIVNSIAAVTGAGP